MNALTISIVNITKQVSLNLNCRHVDRSSVATNSPVEREGEMPISVNVKMMTDLITDYFLWTFFFLIRCLDVSLCAVGFAFCTAASICQKILM